MIFLIINPNLRSISSILSIVFTLFKLIENFLITVFAQADLQFLQAG